MKKLIVSLKNSSEVLNDFTKALKNAKKSKLRSKYEISFDNKRDFNRFIKNIDILMYIINSKPKSVYELSKICNKDVSNLNKIINFFHSVGVIEIKKTKVAGREVNTPIIDYDTIQFKLAAWILLEEF